MTAPVPIHVLWTGGWDSTFRVLDLALRQNLPVQPHYVLDPGRVSASYEIDAVDAIREAANARAPGPRIHAPVRVPLDEIPVSDSVRRMYEVLNHRFGIGAQNVFTVAYAERLGCGRLEVGVHKDDSVCAIVDADAAAGGAQDDEETRCRRRYLACFSFPLLELTKVDMLHAARRHGFDDLMELTWFCHLPTWSGRPCGFCRPCRWTAAQGLAHRLSPAARIRAGVDVVAQRLPSRRARLAARTALRRLS